MQSPRANGIPSGNVERLHREFCRTARRLRRTRDVAKKDQLLRRMMGIWIQVDGFIVNRPIRKPKSLSDRYQFLRFFT
jgi:hypothetical protein